MVSKCLIFSRSRFPLAWFVEGARSLVRGDGGRAPGRLSLTDQRAENAPVVGDRRCTAATETGDNRPLFIDKVTEPP
jgi:hypothetical protein